MADPHSKKVDAIEREIRSRPGATERIDARTDAMRAKLAKDRDEPVTIPLDPEATLRALLQVEPEPQPDLDTEPEPEVRHSH